MNDKCFHSLLRVKVKTHQIATDRKKPRRLFIESSTKFNRNGQVKLQSYGSTHEGVIQSFFDHINVKDVDNLIIDLWKKDANYFI